MTLQELKEFLTINLTGTVDEPFIETALTKLDKLSQMHPTLNCQKFADWFKQKDVSGKDRPVLFLIKCGYVDIQKGMFDSNGGDIYTKSVLVIQDVFNRMRLNGIMIEQDDTVVIDYYENYIVVNGYMSVDELLNWNDKAIGYLGNQNKTSKDFISLFKTSRIMRGLNLNYEEMDKKCEEMIEEWHVLLDSIYAHSKSVSANTDEKL